MRESGPGPASRPVEQRGQAWSGGVEVEELPAQAVLRRGTPRLGMGGTLVVAAVVALLAAGFGVLGGRPDATPPPSRAAIPDPTGDPGPPAVPRVTPWMECGEPQPTVPNIFLQVNGVPIPGTIEVRTDSPGGSFSPPDGSFPRERIQVPVDVTSELWIEDGVCAVAWTIGLVDDQDLEAVPNTTQDPAHASQNRFELVLGPHAGGDYELRAAFVFPTLVARATWPIRIVPIDEPVAVLHTKAADIQPVEGCDVTLTLATGWTNPRNPCVDDLGDPPGDAALVRRGERLSFEIVGWRTDAGAVVCGRLSGQSFIAQPRPGCSAVTRSSEPVVFEAPSEGGRWTVALSACGSRDGSTPGSLNRVCGTWYANIVVSEGGIGLCAQPRTAGATPARSPRWKRGTRRGAGTPA